MNRKQLYKEIASLGLQEEVKNRYGKNYTQCTNEQLLVIVKGATKPLDDVIKSSNSNKEEKNETSCSCNSLAKLVEILQRKRILLKSEVTEIMGA